MKMTNYFEQPVFLRQRRFFWLLEGFLFAAGFLAALCFLIVSASMASAVMSITVSLTALIKVLTVSTMPASTVSIDLSEFDGEGES